jgi:acetyl esterase
MTDDEGVLDPWVEEWLAANPIIRNPPLDDLSPELLALARAPLGAPPTREIARVRDEVIAGVPVRVYEHDQAPTGLVVYFHGGGFCIGSVGLMDNVARELAHCTGAAVISVDYRLAPEHPFPAGLDDCEAVTRWALAHAAELGASPDRVVVAGESAGGNLAAVVALRLRGAVDPPLAGQVLMYPVVDRAGAYPSREQFDGIVISARMGKAFHDAYTSGRPLDRDPFVSPLHAGTLAGLPPAIVVLAGCDMLRDEGRAYARRLHDDGVAAEEVRCAGQPHGFLNFGFPAAGHAYERIGTFVRGRFGASGAAQVS